MTVIKAAIKEQYISTNENLCKVVEDLVLAKIFTKKGRLTLTSLREIEDKFEEILFSKIEERGVWLVGFTEPDEDGSVSAVITILDMKPDGKSYWVESFDIENQAIYITELVGQTDEN